ncbi:ribonuclease H-like domain-containing protein, partial [Tanacetum coccineum]
ITGYHKHQCTKHIEIDIHFVRDLVAVGQVPALHVSSRYQFADIFTKGLPSALLEEFCTSLSVWCPPAPTAGVTWMTFGRNIHRLGIFGEETNKNYDFYTKNQKNCNATERRDGVAIIKRRRLLYLLNKGLKFLIENEEEIFTGVETASGLNPTASRLQQCEDSKVIFVMKLGWKVLRKFHWTNLGGRSNQLSHVFSPLFSKPGEY